MQMQTGRKMKKQMNEKDKELLFGPSDRSRGPVFSGCFDFGSFRNGETEKEKKESNRDDERLFHFDDVPPTDEPFLFLQQLCSSSRPVLLNFVTSWNLQIQRPPFVRPSSWQNCLNLRT